jgi:hypothetical protein
LSHYAQTKKLTPKWQEPTKAAKINDINERVLLSNGNTKIVNVMTLKKFFSLDKDAQSKNSTIANKLLGRQNLIFKQLTPPKQENVEFIQKK